MNIEKVRRVFFENFERFGEVGASFAVWDGRGPVVSLHHGRAPRAGEPERVWNERTLAMVWSATKGLVAAVLNKELRAAGFTLETRVCEVWEGFGRNGKEAVTFGDALSHRAGLYALDEPAPRMDDAEGVIAAIEEQRPDPEALGRPAYHARTYGHLIDGCVRALTGEPAQRRWAEVFQKPLGLDLHLGVPEREFERFTPPIPPRSLSDDEGDKEFYAALGRRESPTARAFRTPSGFPTPGSLAQPGALAAGLPSLGAAGTADALAKFYAMLANGGSWGGSEFFRPEDVAEMSGTRASGVDLVLRRSVAFCAGFMRQPPGAALDLFGGQEGAFGQPGAGGVHAFAVPGRGLGVAYVMNAMGAGVMPNVRAMRLVEALFS